MLRAAALPPLGSAAARATAQLDWRDVVVAERLEAARAARAGAGANVFFLPQGNMTRPLWDVKIGGRPFVVDCTHVCDGPFIWEPLFLAMTKVVRRVWAAARPSATSEGTAPAASRALGAPAAHQGGPSAEASPRAVRRTRGRATKAASRPSRAGDA